MVYDNHDMLVKLYQADYFWMKNDENVYINNLCTFYRWQKKMKCKYNETNDLKDAIYYLGNTKPWNIFHCNDLLDAKHHIYNRSGLHLSPLHLACIYNHKNYVKYLLSDAKNCVLAIDSSGCIPLHHAARRSRLGIIKLLLRRPDSSLQLHAIDNRGYTPIHYTLERLKHSGCSKKWDCILNIMILSIKSKFLLKDIYQLDITIRGDIWEATNKGDIQRLQFIKQIYLRFDEYVVLQLEQLQYTLLHAACESQQLASVFFFLTEVPVNRLTQNSSGCTALHIAARQQFYEACVLLIEEQGEACIESGDNITVEELTQQVDTCGRSPLHWSVIGIRAVESIDTCEYIARKNVLMLQVEDIYGLTPFHYAIELGYPKLVRLFLSLGADPTNLTNICPQVCQKWTVGNRQFQEKAEWATCAMQFPKNQTKWKGSKLNAGNTNENKHITQIGFGETNNHCPFTRFGNQYPTFLRHNLCDTYPIQTFTSTQTDSSFSSTENISTRVSHTLDWIGCRCYGAFCKKCAEYILKEQIYLTIQHKPTTPENISPMMLAIRCCRIYCKRGRCLSNRRKVLELLLIAGDINQFNATFSDNPNDTSATHTSLLAEALPSSFSSTLELLLKYGMKNVTIYEIADFCRLSYVEPSRSNSLFHKIISDQNMQAEENLSILLSTLQMKPIIDPEDREMLCSVLFGYKFFMLLQQILLYFNNWFPTKLLESLKNKPQAKISIQHLKFLRALRRKFKDGENDSITLCVKCMMISVTNWMQYAKFQSQKENEGFLTEYFQSLIGETSEHLDPKDLCCKIDDWLSLTIQNGLFDCANILLAKIEQSSSTVEILLEAYFLYWQNRRLPPDNILYTIVGLSSSKSVALGNPWRILTYCCVFNIELAIIQLFLAQVQTSNSNIDESYNTLINTRVSGRTLIEWVVYYSRLDICKLLLHVAPKAWSKFMLAVTAMKKNCQLEWYKFLFLWLEENKWYTTKEVDQVSPAEWILKQCILQHDAVALCSFLQNMIGHQQFKTLVSSELFIWGVVQANAFAVQKAAWLILDSESQSVLRNLIITPIEGEQFTPLEFCSYLGRVELRKYFQTVILEQNVKVIEDETLLESSRSHPLFHTPFGVFRNILEAQNAQQLQCASNSPYCTSLWTRKYKTDRIQITWQSSCELNQTAWLEIISTSEWCNLSITDALKLMSIAIENTAYEALQWLLEYYKSCLDSFPMQGLIDLYQLSARHTTNCYSRIAQLLLQYKIFPGRLQGDGFEITLLHRAACFDVSENALNLIDTILQLENSSLNVVDGYGNTPFDYACGSGHMFTACLLLAKYKQEIRLEAEFDGQSPFYYRLQLIPSFPWRIIVHDILQYDCNHYALHCNFEVGCSCKGFESSGSSLGALIDSDNDECENLSNVMLCNYCSHDRAIHTQMPYPWWFRDQFELYQNMYIKQEIISQYKNYLIDLKFGRLVEGNLMIVVNILRTKLREKIPTLLSHSTPIDQFVSENVGNACSGHSNIEEDFQVDRLSCYRSIMKSIDYDTLEGNLSVCQNESFVSTSEEGTSQHKLDIATLPLYMHSEVKAIHRCGCRCNNQSFMTSKQHVIRWVISTWLHLCRVRNDTLRARFYIYSCQSAFSIWQSILIRQPLSDIQNEKTTHINTLLRGIIKHWIQRSLSVSFMNWKYARLNISASHFAIESTKEKLSNYSRNARHQSLLNQHMLVLQRAKRIQITE